MEVISKLIRKHYLWKIREGKDPTKARGFGIGWIQTILIILMSFNLNAQTFSFSSQEVTIEHMKRSFPDRTTTFGIDMVLNIDTTTKTILMVEDGQQHHFKIVNMSDNEKRKIMLVDRPFTTWFEVYDNGDIFIVKIRHTSIITRRFKK